MGIYKTVYITGLKSNQMVSQLAILAENVDNDGIYHGSIYSDPYGIGHHCASDSDIYISRL